MDLYSCPRMREGQGPGHVRLAFVVAEQGKGLCTMRLCDKLACAPVVLQSSTHLRVYCGQQYLSRALQFEQQTGLAGKHVLPEVELRDVAFVQHSPAGLPPAGLQQLRHIITILIAPCRSHSIKVCNTASPFKPPLPVEVCHISP